MTTANERIRTLRKDLKLSQTEFANQLGLSQVQLSLIENGSTPLKSKYYPILEKTFNANTDWVETGKGDMYLPVSERNKLHAFVDKAIEDNGEMLQVLNLLNQIQNKQS